MAALVVTEKHPEADGVVSLRLAGAGPLPPWTPGAHIEVTFGGSFTRQYSLCGDPADRTQWTVAVLREPSGRGGSAYVHDRLRVGDRVTATGPRNVFSLVPAENYLFVAGGIGITPILPMIRQVSRWRLVYGGRRLASMAFLEELRAYGPNVTLHTSGLLPLETVLAETPAGTAVYGCGPPALLEALEKACAASGHQLRLERFQPAAQVGGEFQIELRTSGRVFDVPADKSILDVLEEAGIGVLSSCRTGTCGTCEIPVLDGIVDHRDSVLTDDEKAAGDLIIACSSRALSPRLVLDC